MGHVLIPQSDLRWSKQTDVAGVYHSSVLLDNNMLIDSSSHPFPRWYDARRRSTHSQSLSLLATMGSRVFGFCPCLVGVLDEEERSKRSESSPHPRRSRRQLGSWYSSNQHAIPEGSTHVREKSSIILKSYLILLYSLAYDRGWRVRTDWKQYQLLKQ